MQVLSLGCGLETLWFNLIGDEKYQKKDFKFVELDLHSVVNKKIKKIEKSQKIKNLVSKVGLHDNHKISGTPSLTLRRPFLPKLRRQVHAPSV